MRSVKNLLVRFGAAVVLVVSLTACGGGTPTPSTPTTPPAPTSPPVVQPEPDPGQVCVTSIVTVKYEDGTSETLTVDLLRHEVLENRYSTRIQRFNEDGTLKDTIAFTISYDGDGTFRSSGSKIMFFNGHPFSQSLKVESVTRLRAC